MMTAFLNVITMPRCYLFSSLCHTSKVSADGKWAVLVRASEESERTTSIRYGRLAPIVYWLEPTSNSQVVHAPRAHPSAGRISNNTAHFVSSD